MSNFTQNKFKIGIFALDLLVFIAIYFLIPKMLNFPEYSTSITFQKAAIGFSFLNVTIVALIIVFIIQNIILKALSKNIDLYLKEHSKKKEIDYEIVKQVRNDCLNIPYSFLLIQWAIVFVLGFLIATFLMIFGKSFIVNFDKILFTVIRFGTIIFAAWLLLTVAILILTQQYLLNVLKLTYVQTKEFEKIGHRIDNTKTLLIQVLPMILSLLILFAVTAYVKTIQVKSDSLANYYKLYMDEIDFKDGEITKDSLLAKLNTIPIIQNGDAGFVIDPNDNSYTTSYDSQISDFTLLYRDYFFGREEQNKSTIVNFTEVSGMLYESFGIDEHLYCQRIYDSNGLPWYIGFKFSVSDSNSMQFYILCTIAMFAIYAVIIYVWAKSNSKNAKRVAQNMEEILKKEDLSKGNFLPILSNDEVGDISFYYNQIQEKLSRQQDIMLKQEQLSVLGEMAGGMAHDINTPISAINTAITMLSKKTTDERELTILNNMQVSTDRIISIVTSMRNQVRNMGSDAKETFSLNTMVSDLNVIIQNELKKSGCTFTEDIKEEISIYGERTKLGQVLTNLVVNGIQAYSSNDKKGNVTLHAEIEGKDTCLIEIIDEAGGIPEKVQPYIFNNIMTTKGSKGTGLGLYLASTVIKGVYEGEIGFDTVVGKGTKFIIRIPMNREEKK
jgi:signal transduction histidine kinase